MKINQDGLDLIKSFEGCKLTPYKDIVGVITVGYGHTGPEAVMGHPITQEDADRLLQGDLERFEKGVEGLLTRKVSDNQFSALVCFAYNCGLGNLKQSTLLRCINKGNFTDAANEFLRWAKAGGVEVPGLVRRRKAERALFLAS